MEIVHTVLNGLTAMAPGFLLLMIIADIISGTLKSAATGSISSDVSRSGIARKAGELLGVGVAYVIELYARQLSQTSLPLPFVLSISLFFCYHEFISLVENLDAIGVPLPPGLTKYFRQVLERIAAASGVALQLPPTGDQVKSIVQSSVHIEASPNPTPEDLALLAAIRSRKGPSA